MIVTQVEIPLELPKSKTPRSEGVHLSAILRCMAVEGGFLDPKWVEELSLADVRDITDPRHILRICIGLAWEEWYLPQLAEKYGVIDHPGELQVDGIYCSPDAESVDVIITSENRESHQLIVHECKATYKSENTVGELEKQWLWIRQLLGYCKAKNTRFAMLHVLFMNGDYKRPLSPNRKVWLIEFSQEEVDVAWGQAVNYRDHFEERGK